MKKRVTALAASAAAVLIVGAAVAQAQPEEVPQQNPADRTHASEQMREMREQMPADAQEQCDEMHAQMPSQMGQMMGETLREGDIQGMRDQMSSLD